MPIDRAGVSLRGIEDIGWKARYGAVVSPSTVSEPNKEIYGTVGPRCARPATSTTYARLKAECEVAVQR